MSMTTDPVRKAAGELLDYLDAEFDYGESVEALVRPMLRPLMDALSDAFAAHDAAPDHPTPPQGEVEKAREKCVLVCRRAAEEHDAAGYIYEDRIRTIGANAVSMGRALLAAESAAQEGGPDGR